MAEWKTEILSLKLVLSEMSWSQVGNGSLGWCWLNINWQIWFRRSGWFIWTASSCAFQGYLHATEECQC